MHPTISSMLPKGRNNRKYYYMTTYKELRAVVKQHKEPFVYLFVQKSKIHHKTSATFYNFFNDLKNTK